MFAMSVEAYLSQDAETRMTHVVLDSMAKCHPDAKDWWVVFEGSSMYLCDIYAVVPNKVTADKIIQSASDLINRETIEGYKARLYYMREQRDELAKKFKEDGGNVS
jgi:hypothetical protein